MSETLVAEPFRAPQPVSDLVTLMSFRDFHNAMSSFLFALVNLDADNVVTFVVETSEDGVHPDDTLVYNIVVPPLKQGSLEIGPGALRSIFRLAAHTAEPDFPEVLVQWEVKVRKV